MKICKGLCHVAAADKFGSKFPSTMVLQLASSSVLIRDKGGGDIASGVLIAPNVVLAARHSVSGGGSGAGLDLLLFFECDAKPMRAKHSSCVPLETVAQATEVKTLETGKDGLDYALVLVSWKGSKVTFPRAVHLPRPDYYYGGELLAVGNPVMSNKAQHTQAAPGVHIGGAAHGPHPNPKTPDEENAKEYTYFTCAITDGMSGGGVFNERGNLVGICTGVRKKQYAFLNLGLVIGKTAGGPPPAPVSPRLSRWMGGGLPLLDSDPRPSTSVVFDPRL